MSPPVYACICHAVTVDQVETTILAGARTVEEVGDRCGAGTGCGSCVERLCGMLAKAEARPDEVLPQTA